MSDQTEQGRHVRLRTAASDKKKALEHYQELRRAGRVKRAVVIAEDHDGQITVLGQMLKPREVSELLLVAAEAVVHIDAKRNEPRFEPHQEPERRGIHNENAPARREITIDAEGMMVPPPGENLISCGECNHPRWYVFNFNDIDMPARFACAHCGNEIKMHRIYHQEGRG